MSNDVTTNLKFNVDSKQLKQAVTQLARVQARLTQMKVGSDTTAAGFRIMSDRAALLKVKISKLDGSFTKLAASVRRVKAVTDSSTRTTQKAASVQTKLANNMKKTKTNTAALTKAIKDAAEHAAKSAKAHADLAKKKKAVGDAARKSTKDVKDGSTALDDAGKVGKKTGSSLGFTGLAFGFIGGAAAFAGNQIKSFFIDIIKEGIEDIGAMNRAIVQSGTDLEKFLGGNLDDFKVVGQRIKDLQQDFEEFSRADVAGAFKEIGRAVGQDVGLDDIEKITHALLTIARIDETGGAGLPKTAVDLKRVMTQFNIGAGDLEEFLDKLVNTNQQGAIELNQLVSSLGFAGAQTQRFGVNINETLALTGFIFEKSGRKAGAAGRTFGNILDQLGSTTVATNENIKHMGIDILNTSGDFNSFLDIVDQARVAFNKMKAEGKGQIFESALLEEFGFDKTAQRGFLSLVQTSREELEALSSGVNQSGTADMLSAAIGEGADIKLKGFENEIRNLKAEFVTGLLPALGEFSNVVKTFSQDEGFISTLQMFGKALGDNVLVALKIVTAILRPFTDLLKNNAGFADIAAKALIGLVVALTAMGIIFPILGGFFALIFLHEKLTLRATQLGEEAQFVTKQYAKFATKMQSVTGAIGGFIDRTTQAIKSTAKWLALLARDPEAAFKALRAGLTNLKNSLVKFDKALLKTSVLIKDKFVKLIDGSVIPAMKNWKKAIGSLFTGFATVMKAILIRLGVWGFIGGLLFGAGFNGGAQAGVGKGVWLRKQMLKLVGMFGLSGWMGGLAFAGAFTTASSAIMGGLTWVKNLVIKIGTMLGFGGGAAGITFATAYNVSAEAGIAKPGWMARTMAKLAVMSGIGGGASGGLFAGAWAFIVAKGTSIFTAIKGMLIKIAGLSFAGGTGSGVTFASGFAVSAPAGVKKPGFLARMFAPLIAASGISGATAGTIFGTAMMVAVAAAILIGVDMILESLTGMSFVRQITKAIFGGEGTSAKDALGLNDINGVNTSGQGIFGGPNDYANYGKGGGTGRNANKGSSFFDSVNAKGMGGSSNSQVINNDVVISPTINFGSTEGLDEKQIVDMLNKEFGKFLEPKMGVIYR